MAMGKESRALLLALQKRKAAAEVRPLVTAEAARTPDLFYGMKPLLWALSYGAPLDIVKVLVDAHPEAVSEKHTQKAFTALHYIEKLSADVVKFLLERSPASAKEQDGHGRLPLHWAAQEDAATSIVAMLLEAYPEAAGVADARGLLPYKVALDNSNTSPELLDMLWKANPEAAKALPPPAMKPTEPPLPIALMFPGQGSQYLGMLQDVQSLPVVAEMLVQAKEVLGYDLLKLCMEGPEEKLQETSFCHPAMYVAGLAAYEKLKQENPEVAKRPQAVCGLSVGELAALTVAGVLKFKDGLMLAKLSAEAMTEATLMQKQLMLSIAGLEEQKVKDICGLAKKKAGEGEVCQIANYLFLKGFTVAGTSKAVLDAMKRCEKAKALQYRLIKGSGGFHTPLMEPAKEKVEAALKEMLPRMSRPKMKVFLNVDGQAVTPETSPEEIANKIAQQLTCAVKWLDCMRNIINDGVNEFYECGPMKQLKAMLKRIDQEVWGRTQNIEV